MAHDLDAILVEVLGHFSHLPHRIHVDWVDLDAVDPTLFDEKTDYACCIGKKSGICIGIHPALKRAPRYVVRYLVFHEILHLAIPPHKGVHHPPAFGVAERLWPDYRRSCAYLDGPVNRLR